MYTRLLQLNKILAKNNSFFIFGPRGTGKSYLLKKTLTEQSGEYFWIDLLKADSLRTYLLEPSRLRHEVELKLKSIDRLYIVIDEVQKVPALLDEVHYLIEEYQSRVLFILSGSSARKLKKVGANLLAGRAHVYRLHSLTTQEVDQDLTQTLLYGSLPKVLSEPANATEYLKAYVETYLNEEIRQEALVRKVDSFIRFLEIAAGFNGQAVNISKLSRLCGVSDKTLKEYYSIMEDTLLIFRLPGWTFSQKQQLLQASKYWIFDNGVLNAARRELSITPNPFSYRYGQLFESLVVQEAFRMNDYFNKDYRLYYWRTATGQEVDLIVSHSQFAIPKAIEIKSTRQVDAEHLKGLKTFAQDYPEAELMVFFDGDHPYEIDGIKILPWREGLRAVFCS